MLNMSPLKCMMGTNPPSLILLCCDGANRPWLARRQLSVVTSPSLGSEQCPRLFPNYPVSPLTQLPQLRIPLPRYCAASAFFAQSCSINCCARARTRSSGSSKARIKGSTAPGGADCAQVSRALSRTRTFGELSFWAIHSGTTRPSTGCPGSYDRTGIAWGLSPPGTVPVPDTEPVPLTEVRGKGLAAGVNASLRGGGPGLPRNCPSLFAFGPRFGGLSDVAGPQAAGPARNSTLRRTARRNRGGGAVRCRVMSEDNDKAARTGWIIPYQAPDVFSLHVK